MQTIISTDQRAHWKICSNFLSCLTTESFNTVEFNGIRQDPSHISRLERVSK